MAECPTSSTHRKNITWWVACFLAAAFSATLSPTLQAASIPVGTIDLIEGVAFVRHEPKRSSVRIRAKDKVYPHDEITTTSRSKLKITFINHSTIHLGPDSHLIIESVLYAPQKSLSQPFFKLPVGRLRAVVEKLSSPDSKFEIETKTAVAGVVGTKELIIAGSDPETNQYITQTVCEEGRVAVRSSDQKIQGEVILNPLEQSFTRESEAPGEKMKITAEQLEELIQETTIIAGGNSLSRAEESAKKEEKKKEDKAEGKSSLGENKSREPASRVFLPPISQQKISPSLDLPGRRIPPPETNPETNNDHPLPHVILEGGAEAFGIEAIRATAADDPGMIDGETGEIAPLSHETIEKIIPEIEEKLHQKLKELPGPPPPPQ